MSTKLYRLMLCLYPGDLRRRWEEEMVDTFTLALNEEGFAVWLDAVMDIFRVALPLQATRKAILLPFVSTAGTSVLFYGLIWTLGNSVRLNFIYHHMMQKIGG